MVTSVLMYLAGLSLSVSISAMEIALGLLTLMLIYYLWKEGIDVTKDCSYFIPFFIYWLTSLVSLFTGSDYADFSGGVFTLWGMLYFFVSYYFVSSQNIRLIIICLVLGSAALGVSAAVDVLYYGLARGHGFMSIYISTGNLLALGAVFAMGAVVSGYARGIRAVFFAAALCVAVAGIYFTGTRGALLAFLASACLMLVLGFGKKGVLGAGLLVVCVVAGAYFTGIGDRFLELVSGFSDKNTSHGWRIVLWQAAWELIKEYPIFGIGYGAFEPMIIGSMPSNAMAISHPHNAYIHQITHYGIVGFAAFCWFYGKITFDLAKNIFKNKYAFMGFFVIITFLLEGITENNFTDSEIEMFQMFVAGAMLGAVKKSINDDYIGNPITFFKKS